MTLEEISRQIKSCAEQMNSRYGGPVFDELAVISLVENRAKVLAYTGPRNDDFLKNFARDLGSLRSSLAGDGYGPGDFEFARHSTGTTYEAFLVLGVGLYLICNNTNESMEGISKNPRWLNAQVPFVEMADRIRISPLNVAWDTRFILKS